MLGHSHSHGGGDDHGHGDHSEHGHSHAHEGKEPTERTGLAAHGHSHGHGHSDGDGDHGHAHGGHGGGGENHGHSHGNGGDHDEHDSVVTVASQPLYGTVADSSADGGNTPVKKPSEPHLFCVGCRSRLRPEPVSCAFPCAVSRFVWNLFVGDLVHNFTDGIIIAAAYVESTHTGFGSFRRCVACARAVWFHVHVALPAATTIAVILHEIPHELGGFAAFIQGPRRVPIQL